MKIGLEHVWFWHLNFLLILFFEFMQNIEYDVAHVCIESFNDISQLNFFVLCVLLKVDVPYLV